MQEYCPRCKKLVRVYFQCKYLLHGEVRYIYCYCCGLCIRTEWPKELRKNGGKNEKVNTEKPPE